MYPLVRHDERTLPAEYAGRVITCDVDKTYLESDFESWLGLAIIPMEKAEDKRAIAGMAPVLRELRHGGAIENAQTPFFFLTASPPFIMKEVYRKMLIDGVQCDGVTCKDWRQILFKRKKPAWLRRQLPYKVSALLHQRTRLPESAREILIGDDAEADARAYALYADILAGRVNEAELSEILRRERCDAEEKAEVIEAFRAVKPPGERVERIYIYLEKRTDPKIFAPFSSDLVACRSAFQMAVHMTLGGLVRAQAAVDSARAMLAIDHACRDDLAEDLAEGVRRGIFGAADLAPLHDELVAENLVTPLETFPEIVEKSLFPKRAERQGRWYLPPVVETSATDATAPSPRHMLDEESFE
ncbi:hypothetical protein K8I61_00405 [bacterium]|nr:hypothetical protein [bacterium]